MVHPSADLMMASSPTFHWPTRVYYEDTDAGGVVYHARYLNFMERARTEWLRAAGFEQDHLRDELALLFVVSRVAIDYLAPARFNDALDVSVTVNETGRARLELSQTVIRKTDDRLLARAEVRVVCVDSERFRPKAIPDVILEKLHNAD